MIGTAPGTAGRVVWLMVLLLAGGALGVHNVAHPWTIAGPSMRPALEPGDRVLVDPWSYRTRDPLPGEIVLIEPVRPSGALLVKRIARAPQAGSGPAGGYWVLGDNPDHSVDSRTFGGVPRARIVGRVFFRYWPLERAGPIR